MLIKKKTNLIIPNYFKSNYTPSLGVNKKDFIYLGRIHPKKNLEIVKFLKRNKFIGKSTFSRTFSTSNYENIRTFKRCIIYMINMKSTLDYLRCFII